MAKREAPFWKWTGTTVYPEITDKPVQAWTKAEARAAYKKQLNASEDFRRLFLQGSNRKLERLPAGIIIERINP